MASSVDQVCFLGLVLSSSIYSSLGWLKRVSLQRPLPPVNFTIGWLTIGMLHTSVVTSDLLPATGQVFAGYRCIYIIVSAWSSEAVSPKEGQLEEMHSISADDIVMFFVDCLQRFCHICFVVQTSICVIFQKGDWQLVVARP